MMDDDCLHSDCDEEYIKPQMSYCCGSRGIELSPKFNVERNRCVFVALAFVIKLVELTFIAFVIYDLAADGENQLKFNFTFITAEDLKPYNWILFVAATLVLIIYSAARCAGAGRTFCAGFVLNLLQTFGVAVFCGALITTDLVYPYRFILFAVVASICLMCLGICLLTTLFEMNVVGRGLYSALFVYFLVIFLFCHFAYAANIREKHKIGYVDFLAHVGIGGGLGLFIGMIMLWYIQQLITGRVISLNESEYLYVNLLI